MGDSTVDGWRRFWTAINAAVDPVISQNRTHAGVTRQRLSFPAVVAPALATYWGSRASLDFLFRRECYDHAITALNNLGDHAVAMIEGTSGVGKSVFIPYYVYAKVRAAITANTPVPTFVIRLETGKSYFLHIDATNGPVVDEVVRDVTCHIFISDSNPLPGANPATLYLHVSSTNDESEALKQMKKYMKDAAANKKISFYFPPFSFEEYVLCDCAGGPNAFLPADVEVLQMKFDIFGGCLRRLRDVCTVSTEFIPVVHKHMVWYFGNIVSPVDNAALLTKYAALVANAEQVIAAELLELTSLDLRTPESNHFIGRFKSLFTHWNNIPDATGASYWRHVDSSRFMRYLIGAIEEERTVDLLKRLGEMFTSSIEGLIFERRAHDVMFYKIQHGFQTNRIYINETRAGEKENVVDGVVIHKPNLNRFKFLRTIQDIATLTDQEYGLPVVSNFPLIDAAIQNNVCLQMTLSDTHKGALNQAPNIRNQFTVANHAVHMVFVLGKKNWSSFKYVRGLEPQFPGRQHIAFGDGYGASPARLKKRNYEE